MGREIRRVPLDFDHPLNETWPGFLSPDKFDELPCPDCTHGWSPRGDHLRALWYGKVPFHPQETGSTPLRSTTPAVLAFAERNIASAPDFYGTGRFATSREAGRLAVLWNGMWCHHLGQEDVNALVAGGRLRDFTHTFDPGRDPRFQLKDPPYAPTAAEVNEWSLRGFGHDAINASIVVRARCEREGVSDTCPTCQGHAGLEAYPGQRAEAEAWEPSGPPEGEGWQLWETVTAGSPESPVFATAEELAGWMSDPSRGEDWVPAATAAAFIAVGWAPTGMSTAATGPVSGVEFIGHHTAQK